LDMFCFLLHHSFNRRHPRFSQPVIIRFVPSIHHLAIISKGFVYHAINKKPAAGRDPLTEQATRIARKKLFQWPALAGHQKSPLKSFSPRFSVQQERPGQERNKIATTTATNNH
jgi:hypothetical protein